MKRKIFALILLLTTSCKVAFDANLVLQQEPVLMNELEGAWNYEGRFDAVAHITRTENVYHIEYKEASGETAYFNALLFFLDEKYILTFFIPGANESGNEDLYIPSLINIAGDELRFQLYNDDNLSQALEDVGVRSENEYCATYSPNDGGNGAVERDFCAPVYSISMSMLLAVTENFNRGSILEDAEYWVKAE